MTDDSYDWKQDGHAVWWEEGYEGAHLEHPDSCFVERRACPHTMNGETIHLLSDKWRPMTPNLHEDGECPQPEIWREANCGPQYEVDAVGLYEGWMDNDEGYKDRDPKDLSKFISHDPDSPTPIKYWHQSCHSPAGPWGDAEYWTEWGWKIDE